MSAAERLIALLEQHDPGNPGMRQVAQGLRCFPRQLADRFDHYQRLIEAVGAERAARIVVDNTVQLGGGWLAR